ncbi:MAG: HEAT repeat domain-containing protein, partial [Alphaproteobacteria bacterium]|nr:HEAT repeat domain-containing protein [Alphaproteobacteria bacterium]
SKRRALADLMTDIYKPATTDQAFAAMRVMAQDSDPQFRADVASTLANVALLRAPHKLAARAILTGMTSDNDAEVRKAAINALVISARTDEEKLETFATITPLAQDNAEMVRDAVIYGARNFAMSDAAHAPRVLTLLKEMSRHPHEATRITAIRSISDVGMQHAAYATEATQFLSAATADANAAINIIALERLATMAVRNATQAPAAMQIFEDILKGGSDPRRVTAQKGIIQIGVAHTAYTDRAFTVMRDLMQEAGENDRLWAIRQMYYMTRDQAGHIAQSIALLTDVTKTDPAEIVRMEAARNLMNAAVEHASFGDSALYAATILQRSTQSTHSNRAVTGLYELALKNPPYAVRAVDSLIAMIPSASAQIKHLIITHLGQINKAQTPHQGRIFAAMEDLTRDAEASLREAALDQMAVMATLDTNLNRRIYPIALHLLNDAQVQVVHSAVTTLAATTAYDENFARPALDALLAIKDNHNPYTQSIIASAIGTIGAQWPSVRGDSFNILQTMAQQPDSRTGEGIVNGLAALSLAAEAFATQALPLLDKLSASTHSMVRRAVGEVLESIALKHNSQMASALIILERLTGDSDYSVRSIARDSLNEIKRMQQFRVDQNHIHIRARLEADMSLALSDLVKAQTMMPEAITLTLARDHISRRRAVEIVGQLARAHASLAADGVAALATLTTDKDGGVRLAVAQGLGMIGLQHKTLADDVLPLLQIMTTDNDPLTAGLAVNAIGAIGARHIDLADEAVDILQPLTNTNDPLLRRSINNHLNNLGAPRP